MNTVGSDKGFTLVEMLVALALLAIMSAYALATITTLSQAGRVEARIDGRAEIEAVQRHLAVTLADARSVFVSGENGEQKSAFEGGATSLQAVGVLNDQLERGGLYELRYEANEQQESLLLSYRLLRSGKERLEWKTEVLVNGVKSASFRYFGSNDQGRPGEWQDAWNSPEGLPERIEVMVVFGDGDERRWPLLTVLVQGSS